MRVEFIDLHKDQHGVEPICAALVGTPAQIAPSSYYETKSRAPSARSVSDEATLAEITKVRKSSYCAYGARKTWIELSRNGTRVARCTVERLMQDNGLEGLRKGRVPRTTIPAKTAHPDDLVGRSFTADRPNELWVADITYLRTCSGWVYAAFVPLGLERFNGYAQVEHGIFNHGYDPNGVYQAMYDAFYRICDPVPQAKTGRR